MNYQWKLSGKIVLAIVLASLMAFGLAGPAGATDFREGETLVVPAGEVIDDDLFLTGTRIEMNGTVKGDLFAFGQEIVVNGPVEGSLVAAGQLLTVNGEVAGSLYATGFALTIGPEASVGRNAYFGGFSLAAEKGSAAGRSLYAGGYQAILSGEIADDVAVGVAALELNGKVGGNVEADVAEPDPGFSQSAPFMGGFLPGGVKMVAPGLRVGSDAEIGGDLQYTSPVEQDVPGGAAGGSVVHSTPVPGAQPGQPDNVRVRFGLGSGIARRIGEFIALLIVGGLLLRFWPNIVQRVSAKAQERPLPSAGWGCLATLIFAVGVPVVAIAIFLVALLGGLVTFGDLFGDILGLGGTTLALAVTGFLFVLSLVTKAIVAFWGGQLILTRLAPQTQTGRRANFWALAAGALIYEILRLIPVLGWLLAVIVTLVGLGAIYFVLREGLRPAPLVTPPTAPLPA